MGEMLISYVIGLSDIELMEHSLVKEAIIAEESLNGKEIDGFSDDFDQIYDNVIGQASIQKVGDKINPEKCRYLGELHHADYLLHGSIDYLGTGESSFMSPLPIYNFSYKAPSLEAVVTVRLIKANTGEVIWLTQKRGVSKESLWKYRGLSIGSDELNDQLFLEALEKISKKVIKQMQEDTNKGILIFN